MFGLEITYSSFSTRSGALDLTIHQLKNVENKIVVSGFDESTNAELERATKSLAEFKELHPLRLLVNDVTAEKLIDMLEKQNGVLTICSAEGNLFDLLSCKNERGTSLIEPLLKAYSGDRISVDRITREGNIIPNPHISTVITVQPHVLNNIMKNNEFNGRGLLARFLFVKCSSFIGNRGAISPDIPIDVKTKYRDLIFELLDCTTKNTFVLSANAEEVRQYFYEDIEKLLLGRWHNLREFGSKFVGTTIRIAGLIHGAENYNKNDPISENTFLKAMDIAKFFARHAEQIYWGIGIDKDIENAKYILKRLEDHYGEAIAKRQVSMLCQRFKTAEEMEKPLNLLVEHGYIVWLKEDSGLKGRPKEWIVTNPVLKKPP